MVRAVFIFIFLLFSSLSFSQEKVTWSYSYDSVNEELILEAKIEEGWHLYSQQINEGIGPVPTSFEFKENPMIKVIGKTVEPMSIHEYDENFEGELNFFKDSVSFKQKMKVSKSTSVKGVITYMTCNDSMCLPPKDVEFIVAIKK